MKLEEAKKKIKELEGNTALFSGGWKNLLTNEEIEAIETVLKALENSIPKETIKKLIKEKEVERKPYYNKNHISLHFIHNNEKAEVTKEELEVNNKSMETYGEIKALKELLEGK